MPLQCAAVDGDVVAAASDDGTVWVWQLSSSTTTATPLRGHTAAVWCVAVRRGRIISASRDRTLVVWNAATSEREHVLHGHANEVVAVALTADGRHAVSAAWDSTVRVWALGPAPDDVDDGDDGEREGESEARCVATVRDASGLVASIVAAPRRAAVGAARDASSAAAAAADSSAAAAREDDDDEDGDDGDEQRVAVRTESYCGTFLRVRAVPSGRVLRTVTDHDGDAFARASAAWPLELGCRSGDGRRAVELRPDGSAVVVRDADGREERVLHIDSGE